MKDYDRLVRGPLFGSGRCVAFQAIFATCFSLLRVRQEIESFCLEDRVLG